jgi:hypothetical protein
MELQVAPRFRASITGIARARRPIAVHRGADQQLGRHRDTRLVEAVASPDEISELVFREIGEVLPVTTPAADRPDRWQLPAIAVIYVDGDITGGKSQSVPWPGHRAGHGTAAAARWRSAADARQLLNRGGPGGVSPGKRTPQ